MPTGPTHVLYIAEFATGGSVESLLCLVGGLDKSKFRATVLFYSMPDDLTCGRFESAGAIVRSLFPYSAVEGRPRELRKLSMQARIRNMFGRRMERYYETFKYGLHFVRFRMPIYNSIRRQIVELRPDLVHLNNGVGSDTPGILAAQRCKVPTVCHVRTLAKLTYISVAASRSVRKFLCISNAVRDAATAQGVNKQSCTVVPNAVDLSRFNTATDTTKDIRAEFGWERSDKVFTLVGRVVAWKGQDYFIRALADARKNDRTLRGLIVGEGEKSEKNDAYIDGLRNLISKLGLDNIVVLAGHRTDIPGIMRSSDVVVCPSSEPEPFGRVIIESMAVGTTVIATNAGGAPDIIQDDVNGLLVPVKDSLALSAAMTRLCLDSELSARLSSAGFADANRHYTVANHVDIICGLYQKIIKKC